MYKIEINGNVLICDDYYHKKTIREQQNYHYSHYLKLQNLLSVSLNYEQTCKKTFPFWVLLSQLLKSGKKTSLNFLEKRSVSPVAFLIWLTHDHS